MKTGDKISNGHSVFVVGKVKGTSFKARCGGAYFDGNTYDYHFSDNLGVWIKNSEPPRSTKLRKG
jgi:hypothetical protein